MTVGGKCKEVSETKHNAVYGKVIRKFMSKPKLWTVPKPKAKLLLWEQVQRLPQELIAIIRGFVGGRYVPDQFWYEHYGKVAQMFDTCSKEYVLKNLKRFQKINSNLSDIFNTTIKYKETPKLIVITHPYNGRVSREKKDGSVLRNIAVVARNKYERKQREIGEKMLLDQAKFSDEPYPLYNPNGQRMMQKGTDELAWGVAYPELLKAYYKERRHQPVGLPDLQFAYYTNCSVAEKKYWAARKAERNAMPPRDD